VRRHPKSIHHGRIDHGEDLAEVHVGAPSTSSPTVVNAALPPTTPSVTPPSALSTTFASMLVAATGPCIDPGTCDNCHYKTAAGVEVFDSPAMPCTTQTYTKAAISLVGGVSGAIFGGLFGFIAGAIAANVLARPIVDALARSSGGSAGAPPAGATMLPAASAPPAAAATPATGSP